MIPPYIEHSLNKVHCYLAKWRLFRRSGAQNGDFNAILQVRSLNFNLIADIPDLGFGLPRP